MLSPLPSLQWHPRINQIFVGCGGRTGGAVRTFYDPKLSSKGAVAAAARAPRTGTTDFIRVSECMVACRWWLPRPVGIPCLAEAACIVLQRPARGLFDCQLYNTLHTPIQSSRNLQLPTLHYVAMLLQLAEPEIYVPNALPMYREDMPGRPLSKKRRAEKEAADRRYQPAGSSQAKGKGLCGRVGGGGAQ